MPDLAPTPAAPPRPQLKKGTPDGPPGPWVLLAAWGPCGYVPLAPGTAGTLGAIPLFWALRGLPLGLYLLTTVALTALASYAAAIAGRYWKVVDASPIVIDEVVGYLVTLALFPRSWQWALAGFVLFRIFDVVKPWPARYFDRQVKNGFGVVMDDVFAGVWALAVLLAARLVLQAAFGCGGGAFYCAELAR
ncbi:phosphatidylglycerophosphatase A family protein [Anaeromyxobacter diazotrophicus]|uniref:phosphatidylglycerophosphatase A family protein n=1 Tax=Anaeromyxobacter diazotrophicus TaxID=2590199 RepID=UPI001F3A5FB2|nr:phosphatidylglycerophosphatase A [Anaeromyxobacter diazotrophicus]